MFKPLVLLFVLISLSECEEWKSWNSNWAGLPCSYPVKGGRYDGRTYYVIRAHWGGGLLPGKYSPDENKAYVPYHDKEHAVTDFEVLCMSHANELIWENKRSGRSLVYGGRSATGDSLYICKFQMNSGRWVNGKLHNRRCFASYGEREYGDRDWHTLKFA